MDGPTYGRTDRRIYENYPVYKRDVSKSYLEVFIIGRGVEARVFGIGLLVIVYFEENAERSSLSRSPHNDIA